MSESTEELKAAVQGAIEILTEAGNLIEQVQAAATAMAQEAAAHGWYGVAGRMQDVATALAEADSAFAPGLVAVETAGSELSLINDKIPTAHVVGHLSVSATQLAKAETAFTGVVGKAEEARLAAEEIGQEGMMRATLNLHHQLTEIRELIGRHRAVSEVEKANAETFEVKDPVGN